MPMKCSQKHAISCWKMNHMTVWLHRLGCFLVLCFSIFCPQSNPAVCRHGPESSPKSLCVAWKKTTILNRFFHRPCTPAKASARRATSPSSDQNGSDLLQVRFFEVFVSHTGRIARTFSVAFCGGRLCLRALCTAHACRLVIWTFHHALHSMGLFYLLKWRATNVARVFFASPCMSCLASMLDSMRPSLWLMQNHHVYTSWCMSYDGLPPTQCLSAHVQ